MSPRVTRREFINRAGATGALVAAARGRITAQTSRPNLLFILADDLGYGDLSCYGRPDYQTPVLDGLARAGLRFTSAYAAAPVCTPTRCALVTGRYPQRLAVGLAEPLQPSVDRDVGLPPEHPTLASLLKDNGYDTSLVGKWHLGWKPEFGPNRHGFDEFFGILSGAVDYFTAWQPGAAAKCARPVGEPDADRSASATLTDLLTEQRGRRSSRAAAPQPFFLSLHYTAPHAPWEGPEDAAMGHATHGAGADGRRRLAEDLRVDDEEHGRRHRPRAAGARARQARARHAGDLHERQRRRALLVQLAVLVPEVLSGEGGIRVPAIARWPGTIPRGPASPIKPSITMDWTATMLAAAGTPADPAYPLDGEDLMPVCTGARAVYDRTLFWRTRRARAARVGNWKYLNDDGRRVPLRSVDRSRGEERPADGAAGRVRADQGAVHGLGAGMLPRASASA